MPCPVRYVSCINDASRSPVPTDVTPGTTLVTQAGFTPTYTANRETDARTALTRGLAEYISTLRIETTDGRFVKFVQVYNTWAEPEDITYYPSAAVYASDPGNYDPSKFTPGGLVNISGDTYLSSTSEIVFDMNIEIWATDPIERNALVAMLEDGLNPVDFMYGAKLILPHYFGEIAEIEMLSQAYVDTSEDAKRRYRKAVVVVRGRMPVTRLMTAAPLQLRVDNEVANNLTGTGIFVSPIPIDT